jgi:GNAT superfamily N-acetyltransferase
VNPARVLSAYNVQIRQRLQPDGSGGLVEADGGVVRYSSVDGRGWSGISWSDLTAADADAVIGRQVAYFARRDEEFEWKLYDYDQPPDLASRLLAGGLTAGDEEALMAADVPAVAATAALPPGVELMTVTDEAGVGLLIDVHERVFGTDNSQLRRSLVAQLRDAPEVTVMVVAMAGDEPVCSARVEFLPGTEFASLWGGGTMPGWRGRGIYRALVAYRARLAAERGYRYLQVDASPDSQPILARLGFVTLARTTPYTWQPPAPG